MKPQVKNQLAALAALTVAGGFVAYMAFGDIGENLVYFWDVDQLLEKGDKALGATIRLGGVVQPGTMNWDAEAIDLKFNSDLFIDENGYLHNAVPALRA